MAVEARGTSSMRSSRRGRPPSARAGELHRRREWWVPVPGAALAAAVAVWHYSDQPLWRDEWFTYGTVERTLPQMARLLLDNDGGLGVFYLLMHGWMLLGDSVAWMRVPAALCTVLAVALTARLGLRTAGAAAGVVAGLLLALMPTVVDHAQEARAYPLVMAAVVATALAALRYRESPGRGTWWALTVLAALGAMVHPLPGAPAVAGILVGLLLAPGRAPRRWVAAAGAPAGLGAGALLLVGLLQVGAADGASPGGLGLVLLFRLVVAPTWSVLAALALLSAVAALVLAREPSGGLAVLLAWVLVPLVVLTALVATGSFFKPRYVSTTAPAVAVLAGVGVVVVAHLVARVLTSPRRQVPVALGLVTVMTLALLGALLPAAQAVRERPFRVDDPRAAARTLDALRRPGDAVVHSGSVSRGLVAFYAPGTASLDDPLLIQPPLVSDSISGTEVTAASRGPAVDGYRRLWVVGSTSGDRWTSQPTVDAVTRGRTLAEHREFGRFWLELWVGPA